VKLNKNINAAVRFERRHFLSYFTEFFRVKILENALDFLWLV